MNCFSFFNKNPKKGQLATQYFQKIPVFTSNKSIPLSNSITDMIKLNPIQSKSQSASQISINPEHDVVTKTVRKSNYQQLIIESKQKGKKFTDKEFTPTSASLGPLFEKQITSWKRVTQLIQNPIFIQKGISPGDVLQGRSGDCYFLGALAALAERPYRLAKCLNSIEISSEGIYMIKLIFQGIVTQVIVDDYIPLKNNAVFFTRNSGRQIWPMIFEKCWAKMFKNYSNIENIGFPHEAFYALTGAPTFTYYFKGKVQQQISFWDKLKDAQQKDYLIAFGTTQDEKKNIDAGIVPRHIYTLLSTHEIKGYKLVRLRNPWGTFEWKGRASDSDKDFWEQFSGAQKDKVNYVNQNQGIFFMIWQDCPTYFDFIEICQIKDNASLISFRNKFSKKNAQCFEFQTNGGEITITLLQDYTFSGQTITQLMKTSPCFLLVAKHIPQNQVGYQFQYVDAGFKTMPFRDTNLKLKLNKGRYVIYCKYWWVDAQSKQATINLYTEAKVTNFTAIDQLKYPELLQKVYLYLARTNPSYISEFGKGQDEGDLKIYSSNQLQSGGYGFITARYNPKAKGNILLQFQQKDFIQKRLTLKKPYKGQKHIKIIIKPGQEIIILFQCKYKNYPKKIQVPNPKITRLI